MRLAMRPLARRLATKLGNKRRRGLSGLDMRRTIRSSMGTGGVPVKPVLRRKRPTKPDLIVLCDVSGSTAEFAPFTLTLNDSLWQGLAGSSVTCAPVVGPDGAVYVLSDSGGGSIKADLLVWRNLCKNLIIIDKKSVEVLRRTHRGSMDGIVVSGGNTLNQQAIWKAQGIDTVLRHAWDQGIVLGGASAGSLCWFEEGTTDSRPKALSIVKCMGFLTGSHSPHYDAEAGRRPLYHKLIGEGTMKPGYACDNDAGIYFEDQTVKRVVSTRAGAKVYYVSVVNGAVAEKVHEPEMIA